MRSWSPLGLKKAFNHDRNNVRVVALVSPTCPECRYGYGVVDEVFKRYRSHRLKGLVVWLPMLQGDSRREAVSRANGLSDARVSQGWDENRDIGRLFEKTLGLRRTAWDVYLVYAPGVAWEGKEPPAPTFWMHQLTADSGADQKLCLNPARLSRSVNALLEKIGKKHD